MRSARPGSAVSFVGIVIFCEPHMAMTSGLIVVPPARAAEFARARRVRLRSARRSGVLAPARFHRRCDMTAQRRVFALVLTAALALATAAHAQLAVTSNDNKVTLDNGTMKIVPNPAPDTVTVIDLKASPPRVVAEVAAPGSVVGPPFSVALTPDERLALVGSSSRVDPNDPTKTVPDTRVSVIDLKASPPAVIATLEAGRSAAGISINRQGTLALVANRGEGTVSVFSIQGTTVSPVGKVTIADEKSGTSHAAFTPDGKMALVSRDGDHKISVLSIDGNKVEDTKHLMTGGFRPYAIQVSP